MTPPLSAASRLLAATRLAPCSLDACSECTPSTAATVAAAATTPPFSRYARHNVTALVRRTDGGSPVVEKCKITRLALARIIRFAGQVAMDAIVLMRGHAAALLGLDDVQDLQRRGGIVPV